MSRHPFTFIGAAPPMRRRSMAPRAAMTQSAPTMAQMSAQLRTRQLLGGPPSMMPQLAVAPPAFHMMPMVHPAMALPANQVTLPMVYGPPAQSAPPPPQSSAPSAPYTPDQSQPASPYSGGGGGGGPSGNGGGGGGPAVPDGSGVPIPGGDDPGGSDPDALMQQGYTDGYNDASTGVAPSRSLGQDAYSSGYQYGWTQAQQDQQTAQAAQAAQYDPSQAVPMMVAPQAMPVMVAPQAPPPPAPGLIDQFKQLPAAAKLVAYGILGFAALKVLR